MRKYAQQMKGASGAGVTLLKELAIQNAVEAGSVNQEGKVLLNDRHFQHALSTIQATKQKNKGVEHGN